MVSVNTTSRAEPPVEPAAGSVETHLRIERGSTNAVRAADILARARQIAASVLDPEIPVVTLADLGILRSVREGNGELIVTITPTYAGCPAMHQIEDDLRAALTAEGISVHIETVLSPAWTSDWITPEGREKLQRYGIAPPAQRHDSENVLHFHPPANHSPTCPHCGSKFTERLSQFGSTACKALYRCVTCKEPFDYFKPY